MWSNSVTPPHHHMGYIPPAMDEHPSPTMPKAEVKELHLALGCLRETGKLQHPHVGTSLANPPPPGLH